MRAHGAIISGGGNKRPAATKAWVVGESVVVKGKAAVGGAGSNPGSSAVAEPRRGKVQRLRGSGAVDIYYENGEVEERVSRERVAMSSSSTRKAVPVPDRARTPTKKRASQQQPERQGTPASTSRLGRSGTAHDKSASASRIPRATTASVPPPPSAAAAAAGGEKKRGSSYAQHDGSDADVDNNLLDNNESASSRRRVPAASPEMPRRARTAGSNDIHSDSKGQSGASKRLPQSAGRNLDMSDAVADVQKQVTNILDLIAAMDADATAVVGCYAPLFCPLGARKYLSDNSIGRVFSIEKCAFAAAARDSLSPTGDRRVRPPARRRAAATSDDPHARKPRCFAMLRLRAHAQTVSPEYRVD